MSLLPADKIVIKLVGEDNSWYVSCQGGSTESLQWQRKTSSESLVNISTAPQDRVHSEQVHKEGLDLVFRSVEQGDEGEYICVQTKNPGSRVQFDLFVVQPGCTATYRLWRYTIHTDGHGLKPHPCNIKIIFDNFVFN